VEVLSGSTVTLSDYAAIREALRDPALSRSFDKRTWEDGNIRAGIVSIIHGDEHRARRRVENTQFRRDRLFAYEKDLFPEVCERLIGALPEDAPLDLLRVAGRLSMVLSARRTGIDHDGDLASLDRLVELVLIFSKGSAILDIIGDRSAVEEEVRAAYRAFDDEFFSASYERRSLSQVGQEASDDVLEVLIAAGYPRDLALRECAIFLQGGTTTSSHTVCSLFHLLWASPNAAEYARRLREDVAFAQRCVHETLRLRPTTPVIRRFVEEATTVAGTRLTPGDTLLLDVRTAHRDPLLFGPDPEVFDPDRTIAAGLPLWGLAFGGGSHQCIGRSVAGGFPVGGEAGDDGDDAAVRLFGLIALQIITLARKGIGPDPDVAPRLDDATDRGTRWASFPVRLQSVGVAG
jgi:cytochrome P450